MISWSHHKCTAVRTVEWKIKSEANYSWTEFTVIQTSRPVLYGEKPYCSVLRCSKFKLVGKSNNCGHLHFICKNTRESFSDRHAVKRKLNWSKNFRQEQLSLTLGIGLLCCWISFSFPYTEVALEEDQKTHFQWNQWERVTFSVVVPLKAIRCRTQLPTQLPGQTCPVMDLMCLVSQLWSESTVTDVALRHWFVRCGSISARFDISFIMLSSVVVPRGVLQNQILNFLFWPSLSLWNRASDVGLRWPRFHWSSFRSRDGKYLCIRFILRICEASLVIFL